MRNAADSVALRGQITVNFKFAEDIMLIVQARVCEQLDELMSEVRPIAVVYREVRKVAPARIAR